MPSELPPNRYGDQVPWEIPVQLCMRDFITAGDGVLDVGANIGGVAIALARMVGPRGRVHSFEANPKLIPRLRADLEVNGADNVIVVPRAVWHTSGEWLNLHCDDSYYASASSLVSRGGAGWEAIDVESIALDDYCRQHGLAPSAMKLDVEGAEYQVLLGARKTVARYAPAIVLEYVAAAGRDDPVELLRSWGYVTFDINLYERVDAQYYLDRFESPPCVNVLAVPWVKLRRSGYGGLSHEPVASCDCAASAYESEPLALPELGRYVVRADLAGPDSTHAALRLKASGGEQLAYFEGPLSLLRTHSNSHLIVEVDRPTEVRAYVETKQGGPACLTRLEAVRLHIPRRDVSGWRGRSTQVLETLAWNCVPRFRGRAA